MDARNLLVLAGAAIVTLSCVAPAPAQEDPSLGETLAYEVCSECHAVAPGILQSPNPDATPFQVLADTPGMNGLAIRVFLQSPHRTMPLLVLDAEEIESVSAYILSLEQLSP